MKIPSIVSIIMLVLCIIPILPYGYFILLRLVVFGTCIYNAIYFKKNNDVNWFWTFVFIALLFNPIFLVGLPRLIWIPIDLICAFIIFKGLKKIDGNYINF